jgi:hypothetical protein
MSYENPYDPTTPPPSSRHLRPVEKDSYDEAPPNTPAVTPLEMPFTKRAPESEICFEGKPIKHTVAKITSSVIPLDDAVYQMDEMVKIIIEAVCVNVAFEPDPQRPSEMRRVHKFKAKDGVVVDWDFDVERFRR